MKRYIKFYDNSGNEMLAMDSVMYFDNRFNNEKALNIAFEKIQKQAEAYMRNPEKYVKPRQCYAAVMSVAAKYNGAQDQIIINPRTLSNPIF